MARRGFIISVFLPATVVLADDNPRIPGLVARILGDEFRIVAHVTDGEELLEAAERLHPDVLIVDVAMPRLNGIQAVERMGSHKTAAIVSVVTGWPRVVPLNWLTRPAR